MDITFKCPHCGQELEVDSTGGGSSIDCPACARSITIPATETGNGEQQTETSTLETTSAHAREHKHYAVPDHLAPAEALILKPNKPLEVAAKDTEKKVRIRTFKRTDCQEVGRDRFDDIVSGFLDKVGWDNIISVNPVTYSYVQLDTHQNVSDYGVLIVYRG